MSSTDLVAISTNPSFVKRCLGLSKEFSFLFADFDSADTFFSDPGDAERVKCFILDCTKFSNIHEAAGTIQVARQMMERSYIVCVLDSRVRPEDMELLKKSGANLIMLDNEFSSNSKLEFVSSQIIKSAYIPIKVIDLVADSSGEFSLYMLMPKNEKYLRIYKPGQNINSQFVSKYSESQELYIHRNDVAPWGEYLKTFQGDEATSKARICRGKFLKLQQAFIDLVLMISDQTSSASFSDGRKLFDDCQEFGTELLDSLSQVQYPWEIINNSSIGDFGSVERATAVAAYAGLLSRRTQVGDPGKVMLGALFADIGMLLLSPKTTTKVRQDRAFEFDAEEKSEYEKHPIFSLNQILSKRLQLADEVKDMILFSHERMDQKGYPNKPGGNKIREDSMLVRLAQEVDQALLLRMGKEKMDFMTSFENFIDKKINDIDGYSLAVLFKVRSAYKAA